MKIQAQLVSYYVVIFLSLGGIPAVEEHTQAYDNGAYVNDGAGN